MRHLALAALVTLLAACGSRLVTTPDQTPSPQPALSSAPMPSPTEPDVIVSAPNPTSPAASPTDLVTRARGDFDCDGRPDDLALYVQPGAAPSANVAWRATLTLAAGGVHPLDFTAIRGPLQQVVGIADVNGDGCDDAVVEVGNSASTTWIEFFVYDGADLREVREVDKPFIFGGSVRHGDGIECRTTDGRAEIVHRSVSNNTSDFQWDVVERVYQWQGKADLVPWSMRTLTIPVVHERDQPPEPWRYWALSCGKLRTPPSAFP